MLTMAQELVTPSLPAKITDLPAEIYRQIFLLNDEKRLACLAAIRLSDFRVAISSPYAFLKILTSLHGWRASHSSRVR